jgi:hypothetical protein
LKAEDQHILPLSPAQSPEIIEPLHSPSQSPKTIQSPKQIPLVPTLPFPLEEVPFLPNTSSTETAAILPYQQRLKIEKIALRKLVEDQKQRRQEQLKENILSMTHEKAMVDHIYEEATGYSVKAAGGPVGVTGSPVSL